MATVEFEKMTNGSVRYKWSTSDTSIFRANIENVRVYQEPWASEDSISIRFSEDIGDKISVNLDQITTINGVPAPATVEDTLAVLSDDVFNG